LAFGEASAQVAIQLGLGSVEDLVEDVEIAVVVLAKGWDAAEEHVGEHPDAPHVA